MTLRPICIAAGASRDEEQDSYQGTPSGVPTRVRNQDVFRRWISAAPKWEVKHAEVAASLKRCPDTNLFPSKEFDL